MAGKMTLQEIIETATSLAENILKKRVETITSVAREDNEWKVVAEVLERKAVPDTQDILGKYELVLSGDGELVGYKRVEMRRRSDIGVEEEA